MDLAWGVRLMSNKGWKCPVTALRTETSPWAIWQSCPSCHCQNTPITFPFPDLLCIPLFIFDSLIQFIPVYHHIHLQKSARCLKSKKCKNVTSKDREAIDASVSEVNLPISESTLLILYLKEAVALAQIWTQIS